MELHYQLTDTEFEQLFECCAFDSAMFTHEAHLRLAWIHLRKYGIALGLSNVTRQLKAYVTAIGAAEKYNTTLTIAAVRAVYHFLQKSRSDSFEDFILEFPRLKFNLKDLLSAHYSVDVFKSETARKVYLEPDILPFT